ncbi:MAG TPA: 4-hydroxy-tetrahydrodipicolinate reductase [Syntrophorhabdaceae bacterium]|nr:4-hydroxy-tetrahydrodipicolinate reductase [Syntrophorhabdaceae bacterium]
MPKLIITGASGKMGASVIKCALENEDFVIAGLVEAKNHPAIGRTVDITAGLAGGSLPILDDLEKIIDKGDVVIDFTEAKASFEHFRVAKKHGKAHIIGSTGFSEEALAEIRAAKDARIVISPNMSIGMNVLFDICGRVSGLLKDGYDVEIFEMHHRWKKDAPSGSALRLKDSIEAGNPLRKWNEVYGRSGMTGERSPEEVGIMALRGGDVVGDHTVYFAGMGERLEFTHRAFSRDNFARGALRAAKWLVAQPRGVYSMKDVLGL